MSLDLTDRKMLSILDMEGRIPISKLAKKLNLGRDTTNYRLQRLIKSSIIKQFIAQIDSTKLGYSVYKLFFRFQNVNQTEKKNIFDWLVQNKYIYWIVESRGRWDCNLTVFAKNIHHFDEILSAFIDKFGSFVAEQEFNISLEVGALQKNWKLPNQKRELRLLYHNPQEQKKIDELDTKIIDVISNNARLKTTEIAKIIGSTERVVNYRLRNLEKEKIILGYSISIDYNKIGKQFFKSIVFLNVISTATRKKFQEYCRSRPNIIYYVFCMGSWPLEIEFAVENNQEYYAEMEQMKEAIPEIKGYETVIFPKEYKFEWIPK